MLERDIADAVPEVKLSYFFSKNKCLYALFET